LGAARDHPAAKAESVWCSAIRLETAYFEAFHRRNIGARAWLDPSPDRSIEAQTLLRAKAAVSLVEGQRAEASALAQAGLEAIPRSGDRGGAVAEKEWLEAILAESAEKPAPQSPD
jgi:hypothetical protein